MDVRSNGGGLFPSGVEVARMLMDSGDIVLIADSQGIRDSYEATGTSIDSAAPVSLLVNKGTASASEVCYSRCYHTSGYVMLPVLSFGMAKVFSKAGRISSTQH